MIKRFLLLSFFGILVFGAGRWYLSAQHDRFIAEKKKQFFGYRVEHFERERLLFVHQPDGSKDGVELAQLNRLILYKLKESDATDYQTHYYWVIENQRRDFSVPYFSVEPEVMLGILKKEIPELDVERLLRNTREFENNRFNFCVVWASHKQDKEEAEGKTRDGDKDACPS